MSTPLVDARVAQIADKEGLDLVMVDWVDVQFARRLEESHARLLQRLQASIVLLEHTATLFNSGGLIHAELIANAQVSRGAIVAAEAIA